MIIISHEIPLIFRTVDAALVLGHGEKLFEGSKKELAANEELFDQINITLPAVVNLSSQFELDEICCNVDDFVKQILKRSGKEE